MAATKIAAILRQVRAHLVETTERFWLDQELVDIMNLCAQDMWGGILDLHQDHYFRVNTDCILKSNGVEITGVPEDCFRIMLIEPRDTTFQAAGRQVVFIPKKYNHPDFCMARTISATDPASSPGRVIYFQLVGEGAPTYAPKILTAPLISADLRLRIAYNPILEEITEGGINPIPGASDNALKAWTIAYARAKETEDRTPDAGWLGVYATEKQLIMTRLTPRQEQEPDVVEDFFQGFGSY